MKRVGKIEDTVETYESLVCFVVNVIDWSNLVLSFYVDI